MMVWLVWIPAAVLEKRARGDYGHVSVLPIIPIYPLVAWGLAWLLNRSGKDSGTYLIGGLHVLFLVVLLISCTRSIIQIRRMRK